MKIALSGLALSVAILATAAVRHANTLVQGQIEVATEALSDGHVHLTASNQSRAAITALVAIGTRTHLPDRVTVRSVRFFDSVLSLTGSRGIAHGQSYTFNFFGPNPPPDQLERDVQLKAAIFADGSTWGDPKWVSTLQLRRSSARRYSSEALQAIEALGSVGVTQESLRERIQELRAQD